jgi:hypothetical protein
MGCTKKDTPRQSSKQHKPEYTPAQTKLLESLKPPSVLVENGEAAVIKIPSGYLFVIPRKRDIEVGDYKVLFSATGNFREDSVVAAEGGGVLLSMFVKIRGCGINFSAGSATAVYVRPFDEGAASIAKYNSCDPNSLDVNSLEFRSRPAFDRQAFEEAFGETFKKLEFE